MVRWAAVGIKTIQNVYDARPTRRIVGRGGDDTKRHFETAMNGDLTPEIRPFRNTIWITIQRAQRIREREPQGAFQWIDPKADGDGKDEGLCERFPPLGFTTR
jgi:hypothetical protein